MRKPVIYMAILRFLLKLPVLPLILIWRATAPRTYPHGRPFDIRGPLVIDGDTLFHDGRKIRIWGINAPEIGEASGPLAKRQLERLIAARSLHVVPRAHDVYGRLVAQVLAGRGDIGQQMVASGFALSRDAKYDKDESCARRAAAGLWRHGGISDPGTWRKRSRSRFMDPQQRGD